MDIGKNIDEYQNTSTITSNHNLCRFQHKQFDSKNAPGMFQKTIKVIPASIILQFAFVYLNENVIFLEAVEMHKNHD